MQALEKDGCLVERHGESVQVTASGWDAACLPPWVSGQPVWQLFWDRIEILPGMSGGLEYRYQYWTWGQLLLHSLATAVSLTSGRAGSEFLRAFAITNLVVFAGGVAGFAQWRAGSLRRALETLAENAAP